MRYLLVQTAFNYHQVILFELKNEMVTILKDWRQEKARETLSFLVPILKDLEQYPQPEQIIFIQGPGSFTALRIGATWVNAYAYAKKIAIVSLNTLALLACLTNRLITECAITFDNKRFFTEVGGIVVANENAQQSAVINPEQEQFWLNAQDIVALLQLKFESQSQTNVLYVVPPKITLRKTV